MTAATLLPLALLASATQSGPGPMPDRGHGLSDVEAASDGFARCFEPRLGNDPVINAPLDQRVPFEQLDNEVSNAAFGQCREAFDESARSVRTFSVDGGPRQPDWNRWFGLRVMHQRYAFYLSRGALNLAARMQMRSYLGCVSEFVLRSRTNPDFSGASLEDKSRMTREACAVSRYRFHATEAGASAIELLAQRYQDTFISQAIEFASGGNAQ